MVVVLFGLSRLVTNDYFFFAGYLVLQYVVLATAWNILGGYTGYVNFGIAGFFAIGCLHRGGAAQALGAADPRADHRRRRGLRA